MVNKQLNEIREPTPNKPTGKIVLPKHFPRENIPAGKTFKHLTCQLLWE